MEEKKIRKIGRLTFGITLVLLGVLIVLATFLPIDVLRFGLILGPIIFISLGLEIIFYSRKNDINIKYDVIGIILTFFMIFMAGIFSIGNYFINKVLYSDEIKNEISESLKNEDAIFDFSAGTVTIDNMSNIPVNIEIIEDEKHSENIVSVHMEFIDENINIISGLLNDRYDVCNYCRVYYSDNILTITKNDDVKSIDIVVFTNSRNNLKLSGNIIVK